MGTILGYYLELKEGELSNVRHLGMDSLTQTIAFYYDILSRGHGSRLAGKEGRKREKQYRNEERIRGRREMST